MKVFARKAEFSGWCPGAELHPAATTGVLDGPMLAMAIGCTGSSGGVGEIYGRLAAALHWPKA
jgi:hypothetical protein